MAKYNWERIKSEYVEGVKDKKGNINYPTLKELSQKDKCSYDRIQHKSSEGKWTLQKQIYSRKIAELRQEKKTEILASEAAQFDSSTLEVAKAGIGFIKVSFSKAAQALRTTKQEMEEGTLEKLGKALVNYQKAGKLALGESTENQDLHIEVRFPG